MCTRLCRYARLCICMSVSLQTLYTKRDTYDVYIVCIEIQKCRYIGKGGLREREGEREIER